MGINDRFIQVLIEKREELIKQLSSIENTISIFKGGIQLLEQGNINNSISAPSSTNIPHHYKEAITWEQKTLFGLSLCSKKEGTVYDIIEQLNKYDSGISISNKVAFAAITNKTSRLGRNDIIGKKKQGNKFKYFIK